MAFFSLFLGSTYIPISSVLNHFVGYELENTSSTFILTNLRLPRVLTAISAGIGLSVSGLLMQTYFRNSLAGPSILGISTGAGLGVAIVTMSASLFGVDFFLNGYSLTVASIFGSVLVLLLVLLLSYRIGSGVLLLIAGVLLSSFIGAFLMILQYFTNPEDVQKYLLWTMGSTTTTSLIDAVLLLVIVIVGVFFTFFLIQPLNALMLGEKYASSLGIDLKKTRLLIILITGLLTGSITAFCGPIAFIGLAVPHFVRMKSKSANHNVVLPYTALVGGIAMLIADAIAQVPFYDVQLPINAVTSIIAAPIIIMTIVQLKSVSD